ncbi:peptidyl-prolyl cis-trans isomerase [Knoellia sinensis KCTC 19936]|uniref:Peptidyl-prolyl cis-trans isomerase n=1 Tax=Knoellia sinensis KCTC 19936 TaxID=1385520 RepID=A0A0A0J7G1_9MICO|nr:peptidylprolyl isomerase [Knoellia sinensis]KGN33335.1 peptidyl-prolyl cis-trans isomerase [Knoellia sinensis KCTC 19936]
MTKKQERDRARRRWEKQQAKVTTRAEKRARTLRIVAVVATIAIVGALVGGLAFALKPEAPATPQKTAAGCEQPPQPLGTSAKLDLPDKATAKGATWTTTLTTNCGDIVIDLDGAKAPQAVASFIQLARADYWLNSPCHRLGIGEGFKLLQCGSPSGAGDDSPGYGFGVENAPKDGKYARGQLAMARTQDPKAGNGGQFFIINGPTELPDPNGYTIFGTVTKGLDIVDKVAAAGVQAGGESETVGAPNAPISILRVAVTEKKA